MVRRLKDSMFFFVRTKILESMSLLLIMLDEDSDMRQYLKYIYILINRHEKLDRIR